MTTYRTSLLGLPGLPGRPTVHRRLAAGALALLVLSTAACSGDDGEPRSEASGGGSAVFGTQVGGPGTGSGEGDGGQDGDGGEGGDEEGGDGGDGGDDVAPVLQGPDVFPRLQQGELSLVGSASDIESGYTAGSIVFTEDTAVMVSSGTSVFALDRETGEQLWKKPLPRENEYDPVCPTPDPPPGATAVVIVTGSDCGLLTSLDTRTGEETLELRSEVGYDFLQTNGFAQLGDYTYYANARGQVVRIQPDGSPQVVITYADLGLDPEKVAIERLIGVGDGDTLVVKTRPTEDGSPFDFDEITDDGSFIGVTVEATEESSTATVAWNKPVRNALGKGVVPQTTVLGENDNPLGGAMLNQVRTDNGTTTRLAELDPATGVVGPQVLLGRGQRGGTPAWAGEYPEPRRTIVVGTKALSTVTSEDRVESMALYDLETGEQTWVWQADPKEFTAPGSTYAEQPYVRPVGMSDDGLYAYATASSYSGSKILVEIDIATGATSYTWRLPEKVAATFKYPDMYVDGDQVAAFDPRYFAERGSRQGAIFVVK